MAWASEKAALETAGAWRQLVLEIDLTDPDSILPNTGQWTASRTLYLSDKYLRRTSSGAVALTKYQEAVTDWGSISAAASMSTAFETTGDVQITLSNAAITHQEPGSDISGVTGLSPEPIGEEMRLIELVRLYNWEGSAVRVKVLTLGSYTTDQANADVEYQLTTIFTGEIAEVDATHDALVLDITQSDAVQRSKLPGREIDAEDDNAKGFRVPLVYGNFRYDSSILGGLAQDEAIAVGRKPALTPAIYRRRDGFRKYYAWHDCAGVNSGWTAQDYFNTATGSPGGIGDYIIRYHPDADVMTTMNLGSSTGQWRWEDDPDSDLDNEILEVSYNAYPTGIVRIPCVEVVAATGDTNPENATDRNCTTYATLDVDNTSNYMHLRLPPTGQYGDIVPADGAIQAYVVVQGASMDAGVEVELGLWHIAGTAAYAGSSTTLTGTDLGSTQMLEHSITIATFVKSAYEEPPMNWRWQYSDGTGTPSSINDLYVRLKVAVAGSAGQKMRVVAAGIRVQYALAQNAFQTWYPGEDSVTGQLIASVFGTGLRYEERFRRDLGALTPLNADYYIMPQKATIDDSSGTVTGTTNATVEHPIDIANHLLRAWCQDTTGSDLETSLSTFGTFASTARTRLNRWIGQNVAGGTSNTWKCAWTIANDTTVAGALAQLCSEAPMMIQRDPATGKFLCVVYENDLLGASGQDWEKFLDADGNKVTFHPNYFDQRGQTSDRGRPYAVDPETFGARSGGREGRYTDIRVRFRRFAPTGAFLDSVYANPDGQKVWSVTAGDYVEGASGTLYTQCGATEGYLGRRTEEFVLEAVTIQDPATATGLLWYLTTVLTGQPVRVRGFTDAEGCVLKPGHAFQISNDMNLWNPMPYYGQQNWENYYFYCTRVETSFNGREPVVYFEGVQWLTI